MDRFSSTIERLILSRIRTKRVLRYALFMFLSLLAQTMVLNRFRILGVYDVTLEPTPTTDGAATWTAVFTNELFEAQIMPVVLPATGTTLDVTI